VSLAASLFDHRKGTAPDTGVLSLYGHLHNNQEGKVMGILDNIIGQTNSGTSNTGKNLLVGALMSIVASQGGIQGLIQKFSGSGLADHINSWISTGQNKPISPQQVQQGLGQDTIDQLAQKTGMGQDEVKSQLSQLLPQVVDKLTPNGQVPAHSDLMSRGMDMLKGLF
jgi:uncharacterized protein YidB (DUF937 family)